MYGVDPEDALRAFMQVDPAAVKRREQQAQASMSEDDLDAKVAFEALDEPDGASLEDLKAGRTR